MATRDYTAADLRMWRANHRLTQAQAAAYFPIAQTTYSLWERGKLPHGFSDRFERALWAWYAASQGGDSNAKL